MMRIANHVRTDRPEWEEPPWKSRARTVALVLLGLGLVWSVTAPNDGTHKLYDAYREVCDTYQRLTHDYGRCRGKMPDLVVLNLLAVVGAIAIPLAIGLWRAWDRHPFTPYNPLALDPEAVYVAGIRVSVDDDEDRITQYANGIAKSAVDLHRQLRADRERRQPPRAPQP